MKDNIDKIKSTQKEDSKKEIIIKSIENFIEAKNRYIQVFLLIIAVISLGIYDFIPVKIQTAIRYILVINVFIEIYVLQAKDSIMQNKANLILVELGTQKGGLRFEKDIEIDDFFDNAKRDFFLSGMAPSRFFEKFQLNVERLLKNNNKIKIYILFSSLESVSENCAEYHGVKDNKKQQYDLLSKLNLVLGSIENSVILKEAFEKKRLLLFTSNIVFTTSFVGYNVFNSKSYDSKIKVTFYQQGAHEPGELPSSVFDSIKNSKDMYPYFQKIISNQLNASHQIEDENELSAFSNKVFLQLGQCKNS